MSQHLSLCNLPDYPALCQLRDALWGRDEVRGAAVMVGAGFSRCAKRVSDTSPIPPLWSTFEREMVTRLYPGSKKNFDPLKLAEEYRAALGQPALDTLIRRMVADDQWLPSELHSRLLGLPWTDVLTTNWDTLLERTDMPDPDRSYDVVRTISDIARTRSPRIIKLHGSLPSHKPFIFTAEDFRSYPRQFSAFINLAQQVLLENDLCLIGFSGDDPNFLQWAGWVRDQLGENARRIRLVGVLNLSPSQRKVLEERNVFPIDLAPLVGHLEPDDAHEKAANIFIECMWEGRPKPAYEWKRNPVSHEAPKDATAEEIIEQLIASWQADRESYPGWLVAPHAHRLFLRMETDNWSREMRLALPQVTTRLRGRAAAELAWRYDVSLRPLDTFIIELFSAALTGPEASNVKKKEKLCIANLLATQSRHDRDWESFARWIKILEESTDQEAFAACKYQQALQAHSEFDLAKLTDLAVGIKGDDPAWHFRRAHIYCLLHDYNMAAKALTEARSDIRTRRARDKNSIWLLSREAWAVWYLQNVRRAIPSEEREDDFWPSKYHANDCDPWDHMHAIDREISQQLEKHAKNSIVIEPTFDAGSYRDHSNTTTFTGGFHVEFIDELVLFSEKVGAPRRIEYVGILGERTDRALRAVSNPSSKYIWLAARNIQSHSKGIIDHMFGRVDIARLSDGTAMELADKLVPAISFAVEKTVNEHDWVEPLRAYMEFLSRLVIRQPPQQAKDTFLWALNLSEHRGLSHWWLAQPLGNLLSRSLEAVPPALRSDLSFSILKLPLPDERKLKGIARDWPELADEFTERDLRGQDLSSWSQRISHLISVVKNGDILNRSRALLRITLLVEADHLSEEHKKLLASAIWDRRASLSGLPTDHELYPHVYLILPEPVAGLKSSAFHENVVRPLAQGDINSVRLTALRGVSTERCQDHYNLQQQDALDIFNKCLAWTSPPPREHDFFGREKDEAEEIKRAIGPCLAFSVLPKLANFSLTASDFDRWVAAIQEEKIPSLLLTVPHLALLSPPHSEWATRTLRKALASRHEPVVQAALNAMFQFVTLYKNAGLVVPPILCADVTSMCAVRREPGLLQSLAIARFLVNEELLNDEDQVRLVDGLEFLIFDLDYTEWVSSDPRTRSLSLMRAECVRLAYALTRKGRADSAVKEWLAIRENDPFPEVRFAVNDDS